MSQRFLYRIENFLPKHGHTTADIRWVTVGNPPSEYCTWDEFVVCVSDPEKWMGWVDATLKLVGDDWWAEQSTDGGRWEFKTMPRLDRAIKRNTIKIC